MKLESIKMTHFPPLADDYTNRYEALSSRFDFSPFQTASFQERASWLDATESARAERRQVAGILKNYNARIHNSERAMHHIELLGNGQALVIAGGQQAGLFTGPLLVIYKAISVIQQAKLASSILKRPVIPLFWIAGEDHDLDEVDHTYIPTAKWETKKLQLKRSEKGTNRLPVSQYRIEPNQWTQVIDELEKSLIDTEFSAEILSKLRSVAEQSKTLTDSFAQLMAWLFADHGLVLLDSQDPKLRRLEAPMMTFLVRYADRLNERFMEGADELVKLGYHVQAPVEEKQANLFYVHSNGRYLLYKQADEFMDNSGVVRLTAAELLQIAENEPERLSNNVLTRPLMQEYLLPVLGTVLGGSETAYWAQLKEGFHFADMKLPLIMPRTRYTLLERTLLKFLDKFNWTFEDVYFRWQQKRKQWLKEQDHLNLNEQFNAAKQQFLTIYDPLLDQVEAAYPGLKKMAGKNKQKIEEQISFLHQRAREAYEQHHAQSLDQMQRLFNSIKPLDLPQERVYNIVAYLNKYGIEWLKRLIEMTVDQPEHHQIVYL